MKKKYSEPEVKFVRFSVRDIVTTSGMTSELDSEDVDPGAVRTSYGAGMPQD